MLNLLEVLGRPVRSLEEKRFQNLMQEHHYLGCLPKISDTIWYIATIGDQWAAFFTFSAAALKCSARDKWIGWDFRHQYDRLKLLTNNSRFLILPKWHFPNLASLAFYSCAKSDFRTIGRPLSAIRCYYWRPLWIHCGSVEPLLSGQLDLCG